jgi:hypothetical protein
MKSSEKCDIIPSQNEDHGFLKHFLTHRNTAISGQRNELIQEVSK